MLMFVKLFGIIRYYSDICIVKLKQNNLKLFIMAKVKVFFGSQLWVAISVFSMVLIAIIGFASSVI